jgi:hypothetical protein
MRPPLKNPDAGVFACIAEPINSNKGLDQL